MVRKIALATLLALTFLPAASYAQVIVRIAPPAPIVERRPPPPERGFVWIIAGFTAVTIMRWWKGTGARV